MVFYTEVIATSPYFESVSRVDSMDMLEPTTRTGVEAIIAAVEADGRVIVPYETYRSQKRQDLMRESDPSLPEKVGAMGYGCGASFAYPTNDQLSQDGDWTFLDALATDAGLIWCGSIGGDPTAVQSVTEDEVAKLQEGTWYPEAPASEGRLTRREPPPESDTERGTVAERDTADRSRP